MSAIEKEIICISFIERKKIMTFKTFRIFLIVMVFSLPSLCFSAQPDSKAWESFDIDWYYNKTNIDKSSDIISVWIYKNVTNENRKEKIEIIKKSDVDKSVKYQKFDHYLSLWEIDTVNKQKRLKELKDYDDKGNVLDSNVYKDREWKDIKPNSVFDKLYIKLGVTQKAQQAKQQQAREQQQNEQQTKAQQANAQQAKEQQAKEQQAKEQQAREQQAKEQQAREQQQNEQRAKEQQAKRKHRHRKQQYGKQLRGNHRQYPEDQWVNPGNFFRIMFITIKEILQKYPILYPSGLIIL